MYRFRASAPSPRWRGYTRRYLTVGVEELFDKLTEHYARPRPEPRYSSGYAAADIEAVFGG
ncbi:hypothetical protein [Streptosporangium amethystogenes]|uniref:hypothetical protein n=1 Tax=Streptosporangium amethystogenes TaxID=2002 RepID=UPI0004C4F99C|nr:hypothetical protein [Streptosporangium amethystogenes]